MNHGYMDVSSITATDDLKASRARAANDRARLAQVRVGLSQDEKEALSAELSAAFLALGGSSSGAASDPERIVSLVAAGARPAAFDDYELSDGGNYGTIFKDWVERGGSEAHAGQERATWRALEALVRASDLFASNRAYAGNGGMPAVHWLLNTLGKGPSKPSELTVSHARLVEALKCFCSYAPESSRFWPDLTWSSAWDFFGSLSRAESPPNEEQRRAAEFLASMILNPPSDVIYQGVLTDARKARPEDRYASSEGLAEGLVGVLITPHMEFLHPIVFGPSRWQPDELWGWLFSTASVRAFFRSPSSRKALAKLLGKSQAFRRGFLAQTDLVFSLVENCERSTLDALLRRDAPHLQELRNARGDTLLHAASRVRAPVHGLVRAMLKAGFDAKQLNKEGDSAIAIAERDGRKKTLAALGHSAEA